MQKAVLLDKSNLLMTCGDNLKRFISMAQQQLDATIRQCP